MATAQDTVNRAMRMIGILESGEEASADEAADALTVLNDMLHGWAKKGIDLGHVTMELSDTHTTHDSWLEGIRYNLALRLCEEFGRPVLPYIQEEADEAFKAFQAHAFEFPDDAKVDRALDPRYFSGGLTGGYDIDTDS